MGNPNHDKLGRFAPWPYARGSSDSDKSSGHNSGGGNRKIVKHIVNQHKSEESSSHKAAISEIKKSWNFPISNSKAKDIKNKLENSDLHAIARQHDPKGYKRMMIKKMQGKGK